MDISKFLKILPISSLRSHLCSWPMGVLLQDYGTHVHVNRHTDGVPEHLIPILLTLEQDVNGVSEQSRVDAASIRQ